MRRISGTALLVGAIVATAGVPALAGSAIHSTGTLTDLSTSTPQATDGAWAVASATVTGDQTVVRLNVKDLDPGSDGQTFGAHVHTGPCQENAGGAAGPHYNHGGGVSEETEVWLDFTVTGGGTGHATAVVPFAIPAGAAHSIVIHALPTAPDGTAGPRLACLPLDF